MPSFEDDLTKLESVVERLERGDLALEDSIGLFEEGMKLSAACKQELERAEGRVQVLMQTRSGKMQLAEFEAGGVRGQRPKAEAKHAGDSSETAIDEEDDEA